MCFEVGTTVTCPCGDRPCPDHFCSSSERRPPALVPTSPARACVLSSPHPCCAPWNPHREQHSCMQMTAFHLFNNPFCRRWHDKVLPSSCQPGHIPHLSEVLVCLSWPPFSADRAPASSCGSSSSEKWSGVSASILSSMLSACHYSCKSAAVP